MMQALQDSLVATAQGLPVTLAIWIAAVLLGMAGGFVVGALRFFSPWPLALPLSVAVEAVRGTPFLVQCFLLYFGGPFIGIDLAPLTAGLLRSRFIALPISPRCFARASWPCRRGSWRWRACWGSPVFRRCCASCCR